MRARNRRAILGALAVLMVPVIVIVVCIGTLIILPALHYVGGKAILCLAAVLGIIWWNIPKKS